MGALGQSRAVNMAVDFLAENRLLPKALLKHRESTRKKFLTSHLKAGGVGAEIGVQKGFFTHVMLDATRPSRLHLIDPWYLLGERWEWARGSKSTTKALKNVIYWFKSELACGDIVLHIGFDGVVLRDLPDDYFDWVYLDTSHAYEDTLQVLLLLKNKVKDSGIILGDDWFSSREHPFYGQYRAINEFVASNGYKLLTASDEDHQWAIRK